MQHYGALFVIVRSYNSASRRLSARNAVPGPLKLVISGDPCVVCLNPRVGGYFSLALRTLCPDVALYLRCLAQELHATLGHDRSSNPHPHVTCTIPQLQLCMDLAAGKAHSFGAEWIEPKLPQPSRRTNDVRRPSGCNPLALSSPDRTLRDRFSVAQSSRQRPAAV